MGDQEQERFLDRWSRLKRQAREHPDGEPAREQPAPPEATDGSDAASAGEEACEARSHGPADRRKLTREDFNDVDFDALDFNSDYGRFMQAETPDEVRNEALRKLWLSNPVFTETDGLDDYCGDYTDAAMVPQGVLKTAYRVGRGFLSDEDVTEWDALGKAERIASDERIAARQEAERVRTGVEMAETGEAESRHADGVPSETGTAEQAPRAGSTDVASGAAVAGADDEARDDPKPA